jgi:hypothetical protein
MWSFFRGWRRKAGVVTLVMALALLVGWVRSRVVLDSLSFAVRSQVTESLVSGGGLVAWQAKTNSSPPSVTWNTAPVTDSFDGFNNPSMRWSWRGFGVGELVPEEEFDIERIVFRIVPYWSLVLPLTILSAYLILWKPRKSKPSAPPPNLNLNSN